MVRKRSKVNNSVRGLLLIAIAVMVIFPFIYITESVIEVIEEEQRIAKEAEKTSKDIDVVKVEQPLHDVDLPDFAAIKDIPQRKQRFFDYLKPAIDAENKRLAKLRVELTEYQLVLNNQQELSKNQKQRLKSLAKKYKVKAKTKALKLEELLKRVDQIPRELVLVQAANESAWGSSRFARIGLNFFGIWCYKKGCGLVPKGRDAGLNHEVASFDSIEAMIKHYFHNINTNQAYDMFRQIRQQFRENDLPLRPDVLATGLLPYSERGIDYVVEINTMLRHNHRYIKS